ncbi:endonuclease VII domain-containing protein [Kitasatospora sp. NPDC056184]|uniref:endonuclease VII domain-containing protein n=1 Tax=Kitasatospora sp. NPDC056184 TaxID=3345738 RepID=UPI0035D80490
MRFFEGQRGRVCSTCRKTTRSKASHEARMREVYGLAPGEYDRLFAAQGGVCAICGGTRKQRLSVDHCHKTGAIRGLLCRMCNGRLLTAARDKPDRLRAAADYLESYPCDRILGRRWYGGAPMNPEET